MSDFHQLCAIAYKAERSAGRKLAAAEGIPEEQALRRTLEAAAGPKGLAALLATRQALEQAQAQRAAARALRKAALDAARRTRHDGHATPWRAWFDGSAHPNPGRCGIGALLQGPDGARIEISRAAGHGNSSEAEYRALIALLEAAVENASHGLTIYGDSQVVVNDMNGPECEAAGTLRPYRSAAHALLARLRGVTLRWIPRHRNAQADALSRHACAGHAADG